jgi:pilus assembly protein Flp/PilA
MTSLEYLSGWLRSTLGSTERGASLVEYALLLAMIAMVCIVAVGFLGEATSARFESVGTDLNSAN